MSGISYETQKKGYNGNPNKTKKHTFDYNHCRMLYAHIANMSYEEFKIHISNIENIKETMHLVEHILWSKNLDNGDYRYQFSDYGLIHLLTHCINSPDEIEKHHKYIHDAFVEEIKLY